MENNEFVYTSDCVDNSFQFHFFPFMAQIMTAIKND